MESPTSVDSLARASSILEQLLKYTDQLMRLETDPRIDTSALAKACCTRLADLKKVLPSEAAKAPAPAPGGAQTEPGAKPDVARLIALVHDRALRCTEVLVRNRDRVAGQVERLSRTRRAVRAYRR